MKLTYQTGIAALVQFVVMTILNFLNAITSSVQGCTNGGNDCVSNLILSLLYLILITAWYGILWLLAAGAQARRSRRLSQLLIALECIVVLAALLDARHYNNLLGLITSLADALLAAWVAFLAFRLMRAKGGRVVARGAGRNRPRQRKRPTDV